MIRTVWFSNDLASIMTNGYQTCVSAMDALNLFFQEHVYKQANTASMPCDADEQIVKIVRTVIETDDPHLKGAFTVQVLRDNPDSQIADLQVMLDNTYLSLLRHNPGAGRWH